MIKNKVKQNSMYSIIYPKTSFREKITIYKDCLSFWKSYKKDWFNHKKLEQFETYTTKYNGRNIIQNISMLIQYDQISRHDKATYKNIYLRFSTFLAFKIIHHTLWNKLPLWVQVFTLLTFRHNKSIKMKELCLTKLLTLRDRTSLFYRFLKATVLDINRAKINKGFLPILKNKTIEPWKKYEKILTFSPTSTKTNKLDFKEKIYTDFISIFSKLSQKGLVISISGGVDSMVLSYVASFLCKKYNKKLVLLHICYNNREEVEIEKQMLINWAKVIDCDIYIRNITELRRERDTRYRQVYEEVTRNIRFSMYSYLKMPVCLGHNKDDCYENMFSNLSKQIHFNNLIGMSDISQEGDVTIVRPFLDIEKKEIVEFAHKNNIPYLEDSTPKWSNRGKMRDILIPHITNFNKQIIPGLYEMSNYVSFLDKQWTLYFKDWLKRSVRKKVIDNMLIVKIMRNKFLKENYKQINMWIKLWFELDLPTRPSNKSFNNLIFNISRGKNKQTILNKRVRVILNYYCVKIVITDTLNM